MHEAKGKSALFWLGLVVSPALLAAMELFHPAHFTRSPGMYAYLSAAHTHMTQFGALEYFGPSWWVAMHLIQLPLLTLVALGLWSLVEGISGGLAGLAAQTARLAVFCFAVLYTALDAIQGVGLGRYILVLEHMKSAGGLTPEEAAGAVKLLDAGWSDSLIGGLGSIISLGGSWSAFVAAAAAALALGAAGRAPWPVLALLVAFGWEIQISHAAPHGPAAFIMLLTAALSLRYAAPLRSRWKRFHGAPAWRPSLTSLSEPN